MRVVVDASMDPLGFAEVEIPKRPKKPLRLNFQTSSELKWEPHDALSHGTGGVCDRTESQPVQNDYQQ